MSLTKRENEFCRYYASCRNGREAAARAGFAFPERSGLRLLDKESIKTEIERLTEAAKGNTSAVDGLKRLAFGSVTDAVRLILSDEPLDIESLDLYSVSEIKRTDKGTEIKFYDRIKALEALLEAGEGPTDNEGAGFVDAIFKGASAISGGSWSDSDEV